MVGKLEENSKTKTNYKYIKKIKIKKFSHKRKKKKHIDKKRVETNKQTCKYKHKQIYVKLRRMNSRDLRDTRSPLMSFLFR